MIVSATGRVEQFITDPDTGATVTAAGVKGISLNTVNSSVSEYTNYAFNSFAIIGGKMFGANENGLYELTGDDDNGTSIEASFRLALQDFKSDFLKRLLKCYMGIKFIGQLNIKTFNEEEDLGPSRPMISSSDNKQNLRVKFGRGDQSRYWAVNVANNDGEDFTIDTLSLEAVPSKRRIK